MSTNVVFFVLFSNRWSFDLSHLICHLCELECKKENLLIVRKAESGPVFAFLRLYASAKKQILLLTLLGVPSVHSLMMLFNKKKQQTGYRGTLASSGIKQTNKQTNTSVNVDITCGRPVSLQFKWSTNGHMVISHLYIIIYTKQ